jgi:hypothetical protein
MMPRRLAPGSPPVPRRPRRGELSLARVESFSDSVFAFAMTLLVLGLVVPKVAAVRSNAELLRQLGLRLSRPLRPSRPPRPSRLPGPALGGRGPPAAGA